MTMKIALLATIGVIAVSSLIAGLQQQYVVSHAQPSPVVNLQTVLGESEEVDTAGYQPANPATEPMLINATDSADNQSPVLQQLCRDHGESRVWNCSGNGRNYFAVTGDELTVDAPMDIFATDGSLLLSCGGYQVFSSESAQQANQEQCRQYSLSHCQDITTACQPR